MGFLVDFRPNMTSERTARLTDVFLVPGACAVQEGLRVRRLRPHTGWLQEAAPIGRALSASRLPLRCYRAVVAQFVEDDDMIEHIAADTPDEPLAAGILPRTARGDLDFCATYILHAVLERRTVHGVPIP